MSGSFVGPQIPAYIIAKRKRAAEEEAATKASESTTAASPPSKPSEDASAKKKRMAGPAMPLAPLDQRPVVSPTDDSGNESSDDDDFGPAPPAASHTREEEELEAQRRLARFQTVQNATVDDGKPKRDEWMIVPPKSEDWSAKVDPTKIKNRKFQTGKGAKAPQKGGGDNTLWTETPEQKRERLTDEVMGRKKPATQGPASSEALASTAESRETARRIKEYNEQHRNKTLYDQHKAQARFEEDDPSKRAFDREKDIAGGIKIGNQQKQEMLNRAADFGSRFSSGKYL